MSDRQMDDDLAGDGGATAVVSALLLVVLAVFGLLYFFSIRNADANAIDIQPPRISADAPSAGH